MKEELENPHLEKFYKYMSKNPIGPNPHSFDLQKYFLIKRFEKHLKEPKSQKISIQDRFLVEQFEIFVKTMKEDGLMKKEEFSVFKTLYENLVGKVELPQVIVFLKSDLDRNVDRICKRGRECEVDKIDKCYLEKLQDKYQEFLGTLKREYGFIKLIEVDTNDMDSDEVFKFAKKNIDAFFLEEDK